MIVLIDNTVLSNFALVKRIDLLQDALGETAATVQEVYDEHQAGLALGLVPQSEMGWLTIFELTQKERDMYEELRSNLGSGEAACMATERHYAILTDDRTGRKVAQRNGCPVSGTLGLLLRLINIERLTETEADTLLKQMIAAGYHSPVTSLSELL